MLVEVLKQCEDNLSRPNIVAQATQLNALPPPTLLPAMTVNITPISAAQAIAHEI
jgi:hypothetical protein